MEQSNRFVRLEQRDINKETFVNPWPEAGLIVADSPHDPQPSLVIDNGQVVEMDGRSRADFDLIDHSIVANGLDMPVAAEAMSTPSKTIAHVHVDINMSRQEVQRLAGGCTPAKPTDIVRHMNVLEMMMGLSKLRVWRTPANQAQVTNYKEHPALLAAAAVENLAISGMPSRKSSIAVARPSSSMTSIRSAQSTKRWFLMLMMCEQWMERRLRM